MKIAFLLLSGGIVDRGAEHAAYLYAKGLSELGHHVDIYQAGESTNTIYNSITLRLPKNPKSGQPQTILGKIIERIYLNPRGLLTLLFSLKAFPKLLQNKYDVVIPIDGLWEILICKLVKLLCKTKIAVINLAGGWVDDQNFSLRPDIFITNTNSAYKYFKNKNPLAYVVNIPMPLDLSAFNPQATPYQFPLKKPIIISIAALSKYKRHDLVIKAVANIPHASLVIVGRGEEETELLKLGKELLGDRFLLTSASFSQLPSFYTGADVFTLASKADEAYGIVLIEAAACGLPIVTTSDAVRKDIVGESGIYVDPTNTEAYVLALEKAMAIPKKEKTPSYSLQFDYLKVAKDFASSLQYIACGEK